jgi:hypothetical protein
VTIVPPIVGPEEGLRNEIANPFKYTNSRPLAVYSCKFAVTSTDTVPALKDEGRTQRRSVELTYIAGIPKIGPAEQ